MNGTTIEFTGGDGSAGWSNATTESAICMLLYVQSQLNVLILVIIQVLLQH